MLVRANGRLQTLALREDWLRILLAFPEAGVGYLLLDGFQFATLSGGVKENSEVPGLDALVRQILSPVLQSRLLLKASGFQVARRAENPAARAARQLFPPQPQHTARQKHRRIQCRTSSSSDNENGRSGFRTASAESLSAPCRRGQ